MKNYLQRLIEELVRRGEQLKGLIKCPIEIVELNALAVKCETEIDTCIRNLRELLGFIKDDNSDEQIVRYVYRRYQDEYRNIDLIERYGISLLKVNCQDLKYHNRLLLKIQTECKVPLTIASVASFSTESFFYAPKTHVIFVPAAEHLFLQHLPALYHELGHYVNGNLKNVRLTNLRSNLSNCYSIIKDYYSDILKRQLLGAHSKEHMPITFAIMNKWKTTWFEEILCDAFATFLVGPAYAWSWIHIVSKINDDVFFFDNEIYRDHPSDEARFRFMIQCLRLSGFTEEANQLESVWHSLIFVSGKRGKPNYDLAFPNNLFSKLAIQIKTGLENNNFILCSPAILSKLPNTSITKSLNDAWEIFWKSPDGFFKFEDERIKELMDHISGSSSAIPHK